MNVDVDPKTEELIDRELKAGRCSSAGELVRQAVEHFVIARQLGDTYTIQEIEEKIERGLASLDRGEGEDGEAFLNSLEADLLARRKS